MSATPPKLTRKVEPHHVEVYAEVFRQAAMSILRAETVEPDFLRLIPTSRIKTKRKLESFAMKAGRYFAERITKDADAATHRALKIAAAKHAVEPDDEETT